MSPKGASTVLRTANINIIESRRFSSANWKPRRLELYTDLLIIIKVISPSFISYDFPFLIYASFHRINGHFYPFTRSPNSNDLIWQTTPCCSFLTTKRITTYLLPQIQSFMTGKMTSISDVLWVITVLHSILSTKPTLVAMPLRGRFQ